MKRIYISGRITENKDYLTDFSEAERHLIERNKKVINPVTLKHSHDKSYQSYMKECIAALLGCDQIYMLRDWEKSKGAKIEFKIAICLKLDILFQ